MRRTCCSKGPAGWNGRTRSRPSIGPTAFVVRLETLKIGLRDGWWTSFVLHPSCVVGPARALTASNPIGPVSRLPVMLPLSKWADKIQNAAGCGPQAAKFGFQTGTSGARRCVPHVPLPAPDTSAVELLSRKRDGQRRCTKTHRRRPGRRPRRRNLIDSDSKQIMPRP